MIDLDRLIRDADPARDLEIPAADPEQVRRAMNGRPRAGRRRIRDAIVVAIGIAVVVGVALVALSVGGQREHPAVGSGAVSAPPGAARLWRILEIFRRPATAADAVAARRVRGPAVVPGSVRLAATTPWGEQMVLFIRRARPTDTLSLAGFSQSATSGTSTATISFGSRAAGWTASQVEAGQVVLQQTPGSGGTGRGARLFMVVPDGVARVAFLKGPDAGAGSWVSVPVHNNVAFAQLPHYCCGPSVVARWYGGDGRLIKVTGGPPTPRALRVLGADGIGDIRFGMSSAAVRQAISVVVGQAGGPYTHGGSCGIDHQIKWSDQWTASGEPALTAYFRRGAFVGYQYGDFTGPGALRKPSGGWRLASTRGLRVGDTLARGQGLYGSAFTVSAAQGGSWSVRVAGGALKGYALTEGQPAVRLVETIDAGAVGCPAASP